MIDLINVTRRYSGVPSPALEELSLSILEGEFLFVTGPSGSGKTTLLRLLHAAERPTSGEVVVAGQHLETLPRKEIAWYRRHVGVVFQDFKLLPDRTVAENVALALRVCGIGQRRAMARTEEVLSLVGLRERMRSLPPELSGGERQRAAIARAIAHEPMLLLADEPTGSLDPALSVEIMDLLRALSLGGVTVLVATHDPSLIARYGCRSVVLERGQLVSDGPKPERARPAEQGAHPQEEARPEWFAAPATQPEGGER